VVVMMVEMELVVVMGEGVSLIWEKLCRPSFYYKWRCWQLIFMFWLVLSQPDNSIYSEQCKEKEDGWQNSTSKGESRL
jgi:hypothetical protein